MTSSGRAAEASERVQTQGLSEMTESEFGSCLELTSDSNCLVLLIPSGHTACLAEDAFVE